jgi:ABC-type polysaccharide/polyol phosphate export permease
VTISSINSKDFVYTAGKKESIWLIAIKDIIEGISDYRLWMFLGWQDIKQRYRRSVLGPIWLTLSTGILIAMMSVLYGKLFKMPLDVYAPFLASGTIIWGLIASLLNESCTSFMAVDSIIKQVRMPLTLHVCRMVWRNTIIFLHNAAILIPVWIIFNKTISLDNMALALFGLCLIALNALWVGIVLGTICTRFRDVSQIVTNLVQVVFFVTPVMWMPAILEGRDVAHWLIIINPFYHFLELVRAPLLNEAISLNSWLTVVGVTVTGLTAGILILGKFKTRIPYWL